MKTAYIITKPEEEGTCPSCVKAKALLQAHGYEVIDCPLPIEARMQYYAGAKVQSIPQIYFNFGKHVSGVEALQALLQK